MPGAKGDSTVQWTILSVVSPECNSHTLEETGAQRGRQSSEGHNARIFCWCLVPLMLSQTSSSWLTAHLKSVYLAIPPHCLLGAPATKSSQIWSIPSLPIDLDGKPAFGFSNHTGDDNLFEVGDYLSRCVSPRRECTKNFFKVDIWVPHMRF